MAATNNDDAIPDDVRDAPAPAREPEPVAEQSAATRAVATVVEILAAATDPAIAAEIRGFVGTWFRGVASTAGTVRAEVAADVIVRAIAAGLLATARHIAEQVEKAAREQNTDTNTGN